MQHNTAIDHINLGIARARHGRTRRPPESKAMIGSRWPYEARYEPLKRATGEYAWSAPVCAASARQGNATRCWECTNGRSLRQRPRTHRPTKMQAFSGGSLYTGAGPPWEGANIRALAASHTSGRSNHARGDLTQNNTLEDRRQGEARVTLRRRAFVPGSEGRGGQRSHRHTWRSRASRNPRPGR
jgi:hypothetical protein